MDIQFKRDEGRKSILQNCEAIGGRINSRQGWHIGGGFMHMTSAVKGGK